MALMRCPECQQVVSDQAPACPHCGYILDYGNDPAVRDLRQWRWIRFFVGFFFLILLIVVGILLSANSSFR